jgi:hypothetical protein
VIPIGEVFHWISGVTDMQYRIIPAVVPVLLAIAGFSRPSALQAQAAAAPQLIPAATRLGTLSRERAARWAEAAPLIRCAPAPLTEHPATAGEFARPHVAPLEEAFLDAAAVKRTFVVRAEPLKRPIR